MPPMGGSWAPMLAMFRDGMSPTTVKLMAEISTPAALAALGTWAHFRKVKEAGHFDTLDDACVSRMGLDPDERAHLDEWPDEQKEAMRVLTVTAVETHSPLRILWRMVRGNSHRMSLKGNAVEFAQPTN